MTINLTSYKPVYCRPYRLSHHERQQLRDTVDDLRSADIVEDSNSSFAIPVILINKKTGDVRMYIDYRGNKKITVKDKYPLPLIDSQLDRLQGQEYFNSLNLFDSGYYQVPVRSMVNFNSNVCHSGCAMHPLCFSG